MRINIYLLMLSICAAIVLSSVAHSKSPEPRFELLHLWSTSIERDALLTLSSPMRASGVKWVEQSITDNFLGVTIELAERIAVNDPPTGTFWIGGADLKQMITDNIFRSITNTIADVDFSVLLRPEVYQVVKYQDGITALPLGIHIQNHAVYNKAIYHSLGLTLPKNWREFLSSAEKIKSAGYIPLSMSDQRWQIRFLFSSVLVEFLTFDQFKFFLGLDKDTDFGALREPLIEALRIFGQLRQFANSGHADMPWYETINLLLSGYAASSFLGDFSSPFFANDDRFVCEIAPGNRYLLWSFDAIALVKQVSIADQLGQDAFIKVATNPEHIANYIQKKGGIPVVESLQDNMLNSCSQRGIAIWKQTPHKIRLNFEVWQHALNAMSSVAQHYWRDPSISVETSADSMISAFKYFYHR